MTKEVKIGLIGIAALAMLIYGINYLKGINMLITQTIIIWGNAQHKRSGRLQPRICQWF